VAGAAGEVTELSKLLGIVALFLGVVNVVGGYLVADRMLAKFKGQKGKK
jgi:NAD/NADP transhydrogenase alpha subunit